MSFRTGSHEEKSAAAAQTSQFSDNDLKSVDEWEDEMPENIPSLLMINEDIINPMKVLFETATQIICDKNEKSQLENSNDTKNLLQHECSDEKEATSSGSERKQPRTKSKPNLEVNKPVIFHIDKYMFT